jgi:hypothetical protein
MPPEDWIIFEQNFDLEKVGGMKSIEKSVFRRLQKIDTEIQDWISLGEFIKNAKLAFLIDEIAACSEQAAAKFIRKIYSLVEDAPSDHIRVILTFRGSLREYIDEIRLKNPIIINPKYSDCWNTVELTPLDTNELIELLKLFPQPLETILHANLHIIRRCTSMGPREAQRLCDGLWRYIRRKPISLLDIDEEVQTYLERYERLENHEDE